MARKLKIDLTDVESYVRCEEGEHVAVLKKIDEQEAKESGNDMLVAKFEVIKGESTGAVVYDNFVLVEKALWRLKAFLEAIGVKADGKLSIDLDKLIEKKCIIVVGHEEYNGQQRARIKDFKALKATKARDDEDDDDDDDEDEDEAPKKSKKHDAGKPSGKKKPRDDDDDDDDDDDAPPPKKNKKKEEPKKGKSKKRDDDDDDEDWEDD